MTTSLNTPPKSTYAHFNKLIMRYRFRYDLPLAKLTAICGPNQSYKTTIAHNYRLALTGKLPGIETHNASALCASGALVPGGGITNELHSIDGISTFECPPTGKTKLHPLTGKLAALEPFRQDLIISDTASKIFSAKSDLGREAFIRAFGERVLLEEPDALTADQRDIWLQCVASIQAAVRENAPVLPNAPPPAPLTASHLADVTEWLRVELHAAGEKVRNAKAKLEGARELTRVDNSGQHSRAEVDALRTAIAVSERWEAYRTYESAAAVLARADAALKYQRTSTLKEWVVVSQKDKLRAPFTGTTACPLCRSELKQQAMQQLIAAFEAQTALRAKEAQGITSYVVEQAKTDQARALSVLGADFEVPPQPTHGLGSVDSMRARLVSLTRVGTNSSASLATLSNAVHKAEEYYKNVQELKVAVTRLSVRVLEALVSFAHDFMAERMDGVEPHLTVGPVNIEWGVVGRHRQVSPFKQTSGRERGLLMNAGSQALARCGFRAVVIDDDALGVFDAVNILSFARVLAESAARGDLTQVLFVWNRLNELLPLANEGWSLIDTTNLGR